jgi:type I site-specific restriction endonuclease
MIDKSKAISLLGSGVSPTQVASALGCEISYISQLLADEGIAQQVAELRTADVMKYKTMDDKYDELEKKFLEKLENIIPYIMKPDQILRSLQFLNSAKRKSTGLAKEIEAGEVVKLTLPSVVINAYTINMNGNMVKVGERSLAAMPSDILMKTLESRNGAANDPEKIPKLAAKSDAPKLPEANVINENSV